MSVFDFVLGMVVMAVIVFVNTVLNKIKVSIKIKEEENNG